ncbi:hypothetical protein VTO42DRAFT_7483 [Malbranchea cinnamomea]
MKRSAETSKSQSKIVCDGLPGHIVGVCPVRILRRGWGESQGKEQHRSICGVWRRKTSEVSWTPLSISRFQEPRAICGNNREASEKSPRLKIFLLDVRCTMDFGELKLSDQTNLG